MSSIKRRITENNVNVKDHIFYLLDMLGYLKHKAGEDPAQPVKKQESYHYRFQKHLFGQLLEIKSFYNDEFVKLHNDWQKGAYESTASHAADLRLLADFNDNGGTEIHINIRFFIYVHESYTLEEILENLGLYVTAENRHLYYNTAPKGSFYHISQQLHFKWTGVDFKLENAQTLFQIRSKDKCLHRKYDMLKAEYCDGNLLSFLTRINEVATSWRNMLSDNKRDLLADFYFPDRESYIEAYFGQEFLLSKCKHWPDKLYLQMIYATHRNPRSFRALYQFLVMRNKAGHPVREYHDLYYVVQQYLMHRLKMVFNTQQEKIIEDSVAIKNGLLCVLVDSFRSFNKKHILVTSDYAYIFNRLSEKKLKVLEYIRLDERYFFLEDTSTYQFRHINSLEMLLQEAQDMQHCILTYAERMFNYEATLIHVSEVLAPKSTGYTAEITLHNNQFELEQVVGYTNSEAPKGLIFELNKQIAQWNKKIKLK